MIKEENNTIDDNIKTEIDVFGSHTFEGTVEEHNSSDIIIIISKITLFQSNSSMYYLTT